MRHRVKRCLSKRLILVFIILLTFSFISFRLALVENPLAHLLEQNLPEPYCPICSQLQFSHFTIELSLITLFMESSIILHQL